MSDTVVEVEGPVVATALHWSLSEQHRVTVVAKTSCRYDVGGTVRKVEAVPLVRKESGPGGMRCDLAPFLREVQLVVVGRGMNGAKQLGLRVERGDATLMKRRVAANDLASLGPQPPADGEGLARFGTTRVALTAGTDGSRFAIAPVPQRLPSLEGDEVFVLEDLDEISKVVRVALPSLSLDATARMGSVDIPFHTRVDTVVIEPGERCVSLCWRGSFAVPKEARQKLVVRVALGRPKLVPPSKVTASMNTGQSDRPSKPLPFSGEAKAPPPAAAEPYRRPSNTIALADNEAPVESVTPFAPEPDVPKKPEQTVQLPAFSELARLAADDAVPFTADNTPSDGPRVKVDPIPGAPWSPADADKVVPPPAPGTATVDMPYLPRPTSGEGPAAELPPEPAPAEAIDTQPEPAPVADPSPPLPEPKTPEEIERERPKNAWAQGPELGPLVTDAPKKPKRAPRKDLNRLLYGSSGPKKK